MPIMDGMTSSHQIRKFEREQRLDRTTIVALTGLVSASAKLEALESGIDSYITKPVNFTKLTELLLTIGKE
jgi:CheY-like chemotaxis protein